MNLAKRVVRLWRGEEDEGMNLVKRVVRVWRG